MMHIALSAALFEIEQLRAERDAARAGEARAVEALQNLRIPLAQLGDFMYSPVRDASQELLATVNSLANTYTQPALDWLAQQRREAAVEALEKILIGGNHLASALIHLLGNEFPEYETDFNEACKTLNDPIKYDLWVCWAIMMRERDAMNDPELAAAVARADEQRDV